MKMRRLIPITLLALCFATVSTGLIATVRAQQGPAQRIDVSDLNIPSVEFHQTDVRKCLRVLFESAKISYSIAPDVQGTVTVSLKNVRFETMIESLLRQVDATYRVEGGVYEIIKRPNIGTAYQIPPITVGQSGPAITQDGRYIYLFVDSTLLKIQKSDLKIVGTRSIETPVVPHGHA